MTKKRYTGHLLVANPNNPKDELGRSVMLLVTHANSVGIGLQLNNPLEEIDLQTVANNIGMIYPRQDPLFYGGNISQNKIHVVHSTDWRGLSTVPLTEDIAVTNDISVLAAIAGGQGPEHFRACAGYWLWEDGRLDQQLDPRSKIEPHKWEIVPATQQLVFNGEGPDQWRACLEESAKFQASAWF